ncbi:MAG: GNAT family N-acetyltransferase [Acidobacteria bacterium]|jgi:acetyltransferase|nr:GNAT family N-acetyltransferase [Acidobacteriota bacterium]
MAIHRLEQLFNPQRIALIGVSANPRSVGGKVLSNLVGSGFRGVVYPVNPDFEAVMGIPCFPGLRQLPRPVDVAVICAPAVKVPGIVRECGEAGVSGVVIVSSGFRETGPAGRALEDEVLAAARSFGGMRILGPNCLGIIVPGRQLNMSFAGAMPKSGHIAFISQSGALCAAVLDWAMEENIGFSCVASIGNALDVDFGDLIDYLGEDEKTRSIILYVESIGQARKFMTAARAFARGKPIVAYKAGRFPESAQVAASHTGALAAEDAVYDAAFQRAGLARVLDIGEIFDCAALIGRQKAALGPRLAVVTNAGGPGVMAADALIAAGGSLARLAPETLARLDEALPPSWSHGNPVDVLGDARSKRLGKAVEIVLQDPGADAVLVIVTPQAMTNPLAMANALAQLKDLSAKPMLAAWLGGESMHAGRAALSAAGIANYRTPEQAVRAFMTLVAYARNLDSLYETPRDIPLAFTPDRRRLHARLKELAGGSRRVLTENESKSLLEAYGIPTARPLAAATAAEAAALARQTGFPVVLKVLSPDITHKSDVGGVVLDLQDEDMVRRAFAAIMERARQALPKARLEGVSVQPMVSSADGVELILGIQKDPVFGTVVLAGMGGINAELFADRSLGFPPLNERLARRMLESLKIWPLLNGYRGRRPGRVDQLLEVLIRLSYFAADYPEIAELDINPLLVTPERVIALDARLVVDGTLDVDAVRPFEHLALRPYPEEYVRTARLPDGTAVRLRPIRPEDEPMWMELLAGCSRESIYARFRHFFQWQSHQAAIRYCFIDYDREIAMVAELERDGRRELLGVGRLVADPDHESVEYAVLVGDQWQNKGLGSVLTECCLEIAGRWGLKRVVAQTGSDNARMLALFQRLGFATSPSADGSVIEAARELTGR